MLLLISGASGAGKSSVRVGIAADLEPAIAAVELCHLDTVPQIPTLEWRQRMAERAVLRAVELDEQGRHLLLAGDPVAPGEVLPRHRPRWSMSPFVSSTSTRTPSGRGCAAAATPRSCCPAMPRSPTGCGRISIIDGSDMTRAEANLAALQWVTDAIEGRAPVFRRSATSKR